MNSGPTSAEGDSHPGLQMEFRRQMQAWRKILAHCSRKPGRKCVHSLRVATLRLQAAAEYWLDQREPDAIASRAVQRWRRQGRKLRRALGPVRQADVSLAKLKRVLGWADSSAVGQPVLPKDTLSAIAEIERKVKREREAAARELAVEIDQRRKRLNRSSKKLELVLEDFALTWQSGNAEKVLAQLASVAADFPELDSTNLHDFRKRIKKIRYLAEIFSPVDASAARLAASLKRMIGAVGEWHDWQVLTEEASHFHGEDTAMAAAAEFLHAQAGRSLNRALKLCRNSMTRLLNASANKKLQLAEHPLEVALPPRKPVARASNGLSRLQADRSARAS
ncbi:MAG TPA: CHAD domain-containing protein [Terracidiphilus sp.]